uniref:T-box domain-containing protein n=1 Tax=Caenorhabditis japonica TaxID=281687 RepID=A0A8R1HVA7_CAEJA
MTSSIEVSLTELQKWQEFYPKTEMIVTKRRGRVIFPHLNYNISGLDERTLYTVHIHLERVDDVKYKFDHAEWKEAGKGEPLLPIRYMEHPDGARPGEHWMKESVSFSHLKITNDPKNSDPKLVLVQSMHKYQPVVTITKHGDFRGEEFRLTVTQFVVVTAYQSEAMIALKVSHNKFASGFRSNGKKRQNDSENTDFSPPAKRNSVTPSSSSSSSTSSSMSSSPPTWPSSSFSPPSHTLINNQNNFSNFASPMTPFMDFSGMNYWNMNVNMNATWNPAYSGMNMAAWNYPTMWTNPPMSSEFENL